MLDSALRTRRTPAPEPTRAEPSGPAPVARRTSGLLNPPIVRATARRVLMQLRGDRRSVGLVLVLPSVLLGLIHEIFDSNRTFDRIGLLLLGIFPFMMMFLLTSVAMLRERTSGTLERLLTTPMSKLDLLLGYGIGFAVAATAQALVTSATAYWLLGLYTPGSALAVLVAAVTAALLGMSLGLLGSAFATSEFQAVQLMPVVVMPQVLLGGLFTPREQMADWLERVSDGLPLTYAIDALLEVGKTSLLTAELLVDLTAVVGSTLLALALAAATLRRRGGELPRAAVLALRAVPFLALAASITLTVAYVLDTRWYVRTDNAQVDADRIPVVAPVSGTLVDWRAAHGTVLHKGQPVGRIEMPGSGARARQVLRAPSDGTVTRADVVPGAYVSAGTELAVAHDLSDVYVTARVDETDIGAVHPGQRVDVDVDGYPGAPLTGYVREVQSSTTSMSQPTDNTTGRFERYTQLIPVKIAIAPGNGRTVVPGMSVSVRIHKG